MSTKPPSERELTMTEGHQGFKPCVCGKFNHVRRAACWSCLTSFDNQKAKPVEVETKSEPEPERVETPKVVYAPPPEISVGPANYFIPDDVLDTHVFPFSWTVLNPDYAYCNPPFRVEVSKPGAIPSDGAVKRWAAELRQHQLGFRGIWLTNNCLIAHLTYQLREVFAKDSEEMQYLRLVVNELPDVVYQPGARAA